jgi:hypothetical protein
MCFFNTLHVVRFDNWKIELFIGQGCFWQFDRDFSKFQHMLILIILTTCARDHYKRKLLLCDDHDMWEDDVEDHNLQELLQEIAWLMVKCVVAWSFVFLQDYSFWNSYYVFTFANTFKNFQQISCLEISYTFHISPLKFLKKFNISIFD